MLNSTPKRVVMLGTDNGDGTITGVTTGTSIVFDASLFSTIAVYYRSVGTTSGGTIIFEECDMTPAEALENNYNGTWSQIESRAASSFTGGAQLAVHQSPNAWRFLRFRISSTITGGGAVFIVLVGSIVA